VINRTIGIGEWAVSSSPNELLKTYALGSCVAVMIYDVKLRLAGMIHIALPDSSIDKDRAIELPGYFADSGLPLMIEEMKRMGAAKPHIWAKIAGGASVMDPGLLFDIGRRNIVAVKRILWRSALGITAEDTGGQSSRTVSIAALDGEISISSGDARWSI
jgi:chemotaxis protein CheD